MPKKPSSGAVKGDALTKYDERFAKMAKESRAAVSNVGSGGNFISLKGGNMSYQGAAIPENKLRVVVIDHIAVNEDYEGDFNPDEFAAPDCFAMGRKFGSGELIMPKAMAPNPEDVEEPFADQCDGCPQNQWGSASKGKGKACKETSRLALITESDLGNVADAEVAYLKVPVTSRAVWAGFVRKLDDVYGRTPLGFITEIVETRVTDGSLPGWKLDFNLIKELDDPKQLDDLFDKFDVVSKHIAFPFPKKSAEQAAPAAPAKGNGRQRTPPPAPVTRNPERPARAGRR